MTGGDSMQEDCLGPEEVSECKRGGGKKGGNGRETERNT